ncbi:MAG: RHS repeat protein, partial [Xanthomonadales bacterium]|nr:RHS repeat protein [Xanthomonadales bacterium]
LAPLSSIEAARPGNLLPLPRTMHFAQRPVFADVVMQGGMVATWNMGGPSMLPPSLDDPPIAAPAADLQLSFSDGASVEDLRNIGPGVWQYQLRVPPSPARSQGELRVEFAPTPQAPQPTVLQASLPEAWAVVPSLTLEPSPIPVGVGGTLQSDLRVVLGMDPPEYRSGEVRLSLQRSGESVADLISTYGYDGFFALFGRGLRLERDQTYSAVATINAQTPFALDTDVAPLTQSSDVILGVCGNDGSAGEMSDGQMLQCVLSGRSSNLKLKRRIDIPNQRVCDMGAEIAFFLAQPATVSLRLYPIDDMDVSGAVEATLLSAEVLDEGLHRIDLTPGDVRLGTYLYEIDATGQLGNQEMVRGSLSNEPDRRDHLALGHTIVRSVDVFDGQFVLSRSDAQVAGRGPMLAFRRSYSSSLGNRIGPYGRGWSSPIEGHLSFDACGVIQAVGGEGAGGRFVYDHDDSEGNVVYRPLDGYHSSLFRRPSGDFDLYALDGTRYQYDGQEYQLRLIEDTSGNRLSYEYTPIGGRLVVTGLVQDNGRRFDLRYEVVGVDGLAMPLLQQLTGPDGIDVRYRYDEKGLLTEVRRAGLGSADPIEQFSYENFGRYPDRSNPTRSHELGWRLTTATNALSGAAIQYSYNPRWSGAEQGDGSFADVISLFVTELTETDAGTVTFSYVGERGRPGVQTTVVKNARLYDTTYTMNEFGGVERIDDPIGSQSTVWNLQHRKPHSQTDAEGVLTEFSYDAYGNTLQQRLSGRGEPVQASWTFIPPDTFDPPVIKNRAQTYTDFRGVEQTYSYDPAGRLIGHSQGGVSMSYGYDARGDQVSHTDYNGNTTETAYNNLGLPIRMTYADGAVVSMAFDARGRETLRTDELGRATITEYDGLDRPLRVDPPGPGDRRTVYDDSTPSITSFDELERSTI